MNESRSMIEDFIPVKEISAASVREKLGGHHLSRGQIRNLHLWWARRPLAASRAAIYATFAAAAKGEDRDDLPEFFAELCAYKGPVLPETDALRRAREVVSTAGENGEPPVVLDMFAGGGAIPLEAMRLGAKAIALDLNPVAHLIQRCTLEFPQKYGQRLRDAVEKWGDVVIQGAQDEVGDLYPDIVLDEEAPGSRQAGLFDDRKGPGKRVLRPIAFLWTRTIPSPARGYETGMVPLLRQTWLRKKKGRFVALRPVVDREALTVRHDLVTSDAATEQAAIAEWGFDPQGQSKRGATTCPYSGGPVSAADAKIAGKSGLMSQQLLAVVCVEEGRRGKCHLPASAVDVNLIDERHIYSRIRSVADNEQGITTPTESLPPKLTGGMCSIYGLDTFGKLFSPRQQLLLLTFVKHIRRTGMELAEATGDTDFATAVTCYLALLLGRLADRGSTLCRWEGKGGKTVNTFARQALPMVWDYSETNPFGGASGDARLQLNYIVEVLEHTVAAADRNPAQVIRGTAQRLPLDDGSVDAVITDPPYYDNISYADLSDFFYVWHKRALQPFLPAVYATRITPKRAEAVVAPHRHDGDKRRSAAFYEGEMQKAFDEAHRVLRDHSPMVVVYAHKTTLGWSTLVDAMRKAGFTVTEAWPLATERPDRVGQLNTASLASSIFLVARKRTTGGVGDYASEVRPEMAEIVERRVRELMPLGISGADLVIASVGAGLAPFTRYDEVELPNGEILSSGRFLDEVQREVLEAVLAAVFQVDRGGVGQIDPVSRFYVLSRYTYGVGAVEFGHINVLAQGIGIELSGPGSLSDGRHRVVNVEKSKVTVLDYAARGAEANLGLPTEGGTPAPLIDVLHRLLWLMEMSRSHVPGFLDKAVTDRGRLRLLAQALSGRALRGEGEGERTGGQKAIDRLLAQWERVIEGRALPLLDAM